MPQHLLKLVTCASWQSWQTQLHHFALMSYSCNYPAIWPLDSWLCWSLAVLQIRFKFFIMCQSTCYPTANLLRTITVQHNKRDSVQAELKFLALKDLKKKSLKCLRIKWNKICIIAGQSVEFLVQGIKCLRHCLLTFLSKQNFLVHIWCLNKFQINTI